MIAGEGIQEAKEVAAGGGVDDFIYPWERIRCEDPGLPSGIPVMHTIHDPRKIIMNPYNRVGITEYIIHYINKSLSLTWPLGRIQMPRRASTINITTVTQIASVARVMPLPYRRLTGRWILVRTSVVELLTIIFVVFIIWPS
jgi:hypothetical protein